MNDNQSCITTFIQRNKLYNFNPSLNTQLIRDSVHICTRGAKKHIYIFFSIHYLSCAHYLSSQIILLWNSFLSWALCTDIFHRLSLCSSLIVRQLGKNKANLRDLIAATGLIILLILDSNRRFSANVTLKLDGWPKKTIGHLFYATLSFLHHFAAIGVFKLELQSENA